MHAKQAPEIPTNDTSLQLRGDREVLIACTLPAPPSVIYDAWTQAALVRRWWAPQAMGMQMVDCQADVRVGGRYRYVIRTPGGELAFSGTYTALTPPTGLVYTHVFEPMASAGHLVVTVTFTAIAGGTRLLAHEIYPSKEVRDIALGAGAEQGRRETMNQLEALVRSLP
jgi:uncharacterized protein YndB with AHSA1/START domain